MRKIKILSIILFIIGVFLCGAGIFSILVTNDLGQSQHDTEDYETLPDGTKVYNGYTSEMLADIIVNDSDKLKRKHCLDLFCITSMKVSYQKEIFGSVETEIQNVSDNILPAGFINMNFQTDEGVITLFLYHDELQAKQTTKVFTNFSQESIVSASDYQLTYPTDEQLVEYQKTLVS